MSAGRAAETTTGRHRGAAPRWQVGIGCLQGAGHCTERRTYNRNTDWQHTHQLPDSVPMKRNLTCTNTHMQAETEKTSVEHTQGQEMIKLTKTCSEDKMEGKWQKLIWDSLSKVSFTNTKTIWRCNTQTRLTNNHKTHFQVHCLFKVCVLVCVWVCVCSPGRRRWHTCGRGCVGRAGWPPAWWTSPDRWDRSAASPDCPWCSETHPTGRGRTREDEVSQIR